MSFHGHNYSSLIFAMNVCQNGSSPDTRASLKEIKWYSHIFERTVVIEVAAGTAFCRLKRTEMVEFTTLNDVLILCRQKSPFCL